MQAVVWGFAEGPVWGRPCGVLPSRIRWQMGFLPSSVCLTQQLVVGARAASSETTSERDEH